MSDENEYEHGWRALRGLAGRISPRLALIQAQRNFMPISPRDMVLVAACPLCADGGLRMAGYLARGRYRLSVRQCDTCGTVAIGSRYFAGTLYPSTDDMRDDDRDSDYDNRDDSNDDEGDGSGDWRRYG